MAATTLTSSLLSYLSLSSMDYRSQLYETMMMFFSLVFFTFSLLSLSFLFISLYKRLHHKTDHQDPTDPSILARSLPKTVDTNHQTHGSNPTHLTHSLLLELLPSNSPKWATLFHSEGCDDPVSDGPGLDREVADSGEEERGKKKKKKRAKKKQSNSQTEDGVKEKFLEREELGSKEKQELVCMYPFTSSSSATQRKIKQQYDQLVKCHESKGLTLAQVGQFANCLIEARNELQHKSEVIQRKFTITKALLFKADRSSFDRLRQQIYKLEIEQKRLEEDAFVYNWLQQQLKLSPAYKKMLEISACMELKAKSGEAEGEYRY
ncbi:hypothetical protein L1049_003907 [Liquidambar formosana]|uniref:AT1G17665-like protein n=1 Tax=Liquidambar formosana TaxID=63359 RepID=A0AAP0RS42_LIQFO